MYIGAETVYDYLVTVYIAALITIICGMYFVTALHNSKVSLFQRVC